ncbi:alpha/beta hydrolase [uncultured Croceitalea sp.]|uniref:alpha/beta fold hydrolase n=1 Tax=uncultured Croceitalea sp. TaxID=1798908 RepID=UPI0033063E57
METVFGKVEYTDIGSGRPIVFLHGGHSNCNERLFHQGYDIARFRLITPSRPGYGKTPLNSGETPEKAARLVLCLIDLLHLKKIVIVGISAGGLTAIALANIMKNGVDKLVLISAISKKWLTKNDLRWYLSKVLFHPMTETITWKLVNVGFQVVPRYFTKTFFKQFSNKKSVKIDEGERRGLKEMVALQRSGYGFLNDIHQGLKVDVLKAVQCPTLILHSLNDASVAVDIAYHAHKNIRNSELKIYNNKWGHLLWLGYDNQEPIREVNNYIASK